MAEMKAEKFLFTPEAAAIVDTERGEEKLYSQREVIELLELFANKRLASQEEEIKRLLWIIHNYIAHDSDCAVGKDTPEGKYPIVPGGSCTCGAFKKAMSEESSEALTPKP